MGMSANVHWREARIRARLLRLRVVERRVVVFGAAHCIAVVSRPRFGRVHRAIPNGHAVIIVSFVLVFAHSRDARNNIYI